MCSAFERFPLDVHIGRYITQCQSSYQNRHASYVQYCILPNRYMHLPNRPVEQPRSFGLPSTQCILYRGSPLVKQADRLTFNLAKSKAIKGKSLFVATEWLFYPITSAVNIGILNKMYRRCQVLGMRLKTALFIPTVRIQVVAQQKSDLYSWATINLSIFLVRWVETRSSLWIIL